MSEKHMLALTIQGKLFLSHRKRLKGIYQTHDDVSSFTQFSLLQQLQLCHYFAIFQPRWAYIKLSWYHPKLDECCSPHKEEHNSYNDNRILRLHDECVKKHTEFLSPK